MKNLTRISKSGPAQKLSPLCTRSMAQSLCMALLAVVVLAGCDSDGATITSRTGVLVRGAPMAGGANGLYFDQNDRLYVANALGQTISVLDPETGEILDQLGAAEGVEVGADDLTFDAFGTLYWTDITNGKVKALTSGGESFSVAEGFPRANPITVGDDGRLFFAQCFADGPNGIFEADPMGVIPPVTIRGDDPDCASNGMDWRNGELYSPRWFEGRVVSVDIDTGALTDITTDWGLPAAVKFNSQGELHAVNQGNGEVVKINIQTGEREILAVFPVGWVDNLAFDSRDRLFVSSASEGTVVEILDNGDIREVSPGGMIISMGLAFANGLLYTTDTQTFRGFKPETGVPIETFTFPFGFVPIDTPTNISAVDNKLILTSLASGELLIWDPATQSTELKTTFLAPVDAEPFQGDLLVSSLIGIVTRAKMPDLTDREVVASGLGYAAGIAVHDDDVYVSDAVNGTVVMIIRGGVVLADPEVIASDLEVPEGISLNPDGTRLLVAEGGASRLTEVDLESGAKNTVADELGFQPIGSIPGLRTHWFNDVEVDEKGAIYVNSDGANIIYRFQP